jgi:hypothetical protein
MSEPQNSGYWHCQRCDHPNDHALTSCHACNTERDAEKLLPYPESMLTDGLLTAMSALQARLEKANAESKRYLSGLASAEMEVQVLRLALRNIRLQVHNQRTAHENTAFLDIIARHIESALAHAEKSQPALSSPGCLPSCTAQGKLKKMRATMKILADVFRGYEALHLRKGTPDGVEKAKRNAEFAEVAEGAIAESE